MITKLSIQNFKSIKEAELNLGKITVLTGANNSGKSSFIYSILSLKNTINNPNQSIDACLTLPFINLGGFQQTVYLKDEGLNINIGISAKDEYVESEYSVSFGKRISKLILRSQDLLKINAELDIAFPYPVNKLGEFTFKGDGIDGVFNWNGILATLQKVELSPALVEDLLGETQNSIKNNVSVFFEKTIQVPIKELSKIDFVPLRRGFTKPFFSPVPLQAQINTEEEIATLLALDRDLTGRVAHYLEKIVERSFTVYTTPGTANFYLQTRNKRNGFTSDLVNEGLGTNQLVTILAKILKKGNDFICIDEPEIHLHPSIIDKLVSVIVEISEQENKQFLISTHSEHFINSLLANVINEQIKPDEINVYYLSKDKKDTKIEQLDINKDGQIKGGLKSFYDTELSNMKKLFKITD